MVPDSYVINEETKYTISLTVEHALVTGSFIEIIFPSDLVIATNEPCSSGAHLCEVNGVDNLTVTLQSGLSASSAISIVVNKVTNANEAK